MSFDASKIEENLPLVKEEWGGFLFNYIEDQIVWSRLTFGHGQRTEGVLKHIESEIAEVRQQPDDLEEWVDIIILALDGAWRSGHTTHEIIHTMAQKQLKNFMRQWPEPNGKDEPVEHIRASAGTDKG